MPLDHLAKLNIKQRRATEHGVGREGGFLSAPLLVIAGPGSWKINTLAHRVVNLIVNGADPRRSLLMTFSRRAATEMSRRVESICAKVLGAKAGIMTDALTWAGTFHAIGARLLREYAGQIDHALVIVGRGCKKDERGLAL
jgi:DNA helicase-2/ATP-dependent DNA helicase PcrA